MNDGDLLAQWLGGELELTTGGDEQQRVRGEVIRLVGAVDYALASLDQTRRELSGDSLQLEDDPLVDAFAKGRWSGLRSAELAVSHVRNAVVAAAIGVGDEEGGET